MDIKIAVPSAHEKGYLRRQQKALAFAEMMRNENPSPSTVEAMAEFISEFVTEPKDKHEAKEAILDLSQEDFEEVIKAITGQNNTLPKVSGSASEDGT